MNDIDMIIMIRESISRAFAPEITNVHIWSIRCISSLMGL